MSTSRTSHPPTRDPAKPKVGWGRKPSNRIIAERVAECVRLLSARQNLHQCELRRIFTEKWHCHWITVDRYVIRARETMLERLRRSKEEFRCESLATYERIANDPNARPSERVAACKAKDELLGLKEPNRVSLEGYGGGPIRSEVLQFDVTVSDAEVLKRMTPDELRSMESLLETARSRVTLPAVAPLAVPGVAEAIAAGGNGGGNGNGNGHRS